MGHELSRMIRDGAPESWTPLMRLLAMVIADDALDPSQGLPPDGGWPLSRIRLHGHHADDGRWYDGLAERTGMSERVISRVLGDLARAGYEMREQIGTDRHGRPVFAYPWRARRFRVLPLQPRKPPDREVITNTTETATFTRLDSYRPPDSASYSPPDPVTYSPPDPVTYSPPDPVTTAEQGPQVATSGGVGDQNWRPSRSPDPVAPYPFPLPNPDSSRRTTRTGSSGPATVTAADLNGQAEGAQDAAPGPAPGGRARLPSGLLPGQPADRPGTGQCPACCRWVSLVGMGLTKPHPDFDTGQPCPGRGQPPVTPVPCLHCGRTGQRLWSLDGLCKDCRQDLTAGSP
jgi:hypothetical protein